MGVFVWGRVRADAEDGFGPVLGAIWGFRPGLLSVTV